MTKEIGPADHLETLKIISRVEKISFPDSIPLLPRLSAIQVIGLGGRTDTGKFIHSTLLLVFKRP